MWLVRHHGSFWENFGHVEVLEILHHWRCGYCQDHGFTWRWLLKYSSLTVYTKDTENSYYGNYYTAAWQRTSRVATKPAAANGYVLSRVHCMYGSSVTTCFDLATSTITLSSPAMVVLQQRRPPQPRRPPPQAQLKGMPWHMHRPHRPQSQKPTGVRTVMLILANAGVAARPCPVKNQSVRQVRPLCKQGVVAASKFTTTWCRVATQNQGIVQPGLSPTLLRRQQFQLFSWSCLLCACCDALEIDICRFLCDFCNCKYLLCLLCTVSYCTEQSQCTLRAWVWLEEFQLSTRSSLKCLLHFDIFLSLVGSDFNVLLSFLVCSFAWLLARNPVGRAEQLGSVTWSLEKRPVALRCLFWTSFYLTVAGIARHFCEFCAKDFNCTPSPLKAKDENGRSLVKFRFSQWPLGNKVGCDTM